MKVMLRLIRLLLFVRGQQVKFGYSDVRFWAADDVYFCIATDSISNKFIYHCLLNQKAKILSQVRRASIPRLSKSVVEKLIIPIPCPDNPQKSLAIQAEIVRILDALTSLTAELTAELSMRKKQYHYYRDSLLTFFEDKQIPFIKKLLDGAEVAWLPLGDITTLKRGRVMSKGYLLKMLVIFPFIALKLQKME